MLVGILYYEIKKNNKNMVQNINSFQSAHDAEED